jgi:putative FmdB family regulatory protein
VPTYQYACTDCDHAFDQVQAFSDDTLTVCPRCEGRLRKIFNAVGVVFKGSGFYRTDNRAEVKDKASDKPADASSDKPDKPAAAKKPAESGSGSTSESTSAGKSGSTKKKADATSAA